MAAVSDDSPRFTTIRVQARTHSAVKELKHQLRADSLEEVLLHLLAAWARQPPVVEGLGNDDLSRTERLDEIERELGLGSLTGTKR